MKLEILNNSVQVDVLYPGSPLFIWWDYYSIQLLMKPILEYSINHTMLYGLDIRYNLAWAPHHLGHWPGTCACRTVPYTLLDQEIILMLNIPFEGENFSGFLGPSVKVLSANYDGRGLQHPWALGCRWTRRKIVCACAYLDS